MKTTAAGYGTETPWIIPFDAKEQLGESRMRS